MPRLVIISCSISLLASTARFGKWITGTFQLVRYLHAWILRICLRHTPWIKVWPHRNHAAWPTAVGSRHLILTRHADREDFPTRRMIHVPASQTADLLSVDELFQTQ